MVTGIVPSQFGMEALAARFAGRKSGTVPEHQQVQSQQTLSENEGVPTTRSATESWFPPALISAPSFEPFSGWIANPSLHPLPLIEAPNITDTKGNEESWETDSNEEPTLVRSPSQQDSELSHQEQQEVADLKRRDQAVKRHEQAHAAAGGQFVRGVSFDYVQGPDGNRYAASGEVSITVAPGSTPQETIQRAQQIRAAALAPADPSPQDRRVAAEASRMEAKARKQLSDLTQAQQQERIEQQQASSEAMRQSLGVSPDTPTGIEAATETLKELPQHNEASKADMAPIQPSIEAYDTAPTVQRTLEVYA